MPSFKQMAHSSSLVFHGFWTDQMYLRMHIPVYDNDAQLIVESNDKIGQKEKFSKF